MRTFCGVCGVFLKPHQREKEACDEHGGMSLTKKIEKMGRDDIVPLLENIGIACYDDESTVVLREALQDSVEAGDISEDQL